MKLIKIVGSIIGILSQISVNINQEWMDMTATNLNSVVSADIHTPTYALSVAISEQNFKEATAYCRNDRKTMFRVLGELDLEELFTRKNLNKVWTPIYYSQLFEGLVEDKGYPPALNYLDKTVHLDPMLTLTENEKIVLKKSETGFSYEKLDKNLMASVICLEEIGFPNRSIDQIFLRNQKANVLENLETLQKSIKNGISDFKNLLKTFEEIGNFPVEIIEGSIYLNEQTHGRYLRDQKYKDLTKKFFETLEKKDMSAWVDFNTFLENYAKAVLRPLQEIEKIFKDPLSALKGDFRNLVQPDLNIHFRVLNNETTFLVLGTYVEERLGIHNHSLGVFDVIKKFFNPHLKEEFFDSEIDFDDMISLVMSGFSLITSFIALCKKRKKSKKIYTTLPKRRSILSRKRQAPKAVEKPVKMPRMSKNRANVRASAPTLMEMNETPAHLAESLLSLYEPPKKVSFFNRRSASYT